MKFSLKSVLFVTVTFVSLPALANNWQRVLTCDEGRVWVDVDQNERRHVQMVIRNRDANRYLDSLHIGGDYTNGGDWEKGFSGWQNFGIFSAEEFRGAYSRKHLTYAADRNVMNCDLELSFFREADGLKIMFVRKNVERCRNNSYNGRWGNCTDGTYWVDSEYVGDYFFHGCE